MKWLRIFIGAFIFVLILEELIKMEYERENFWSLTKLGLMFMFEIKMLGG